MKDFLIQLLLENCPNETDHFKPFLTGHAIFIHQY
jgi:hypothetical protein